MSLNDIHNRESILSAIAECRRLGRDKFLSEYGFGKSIAYFIVFEGELFDSKAIVGVAHGYEFPSLGQLRSSDFSGGANTVQRKLEELGFSVQHVSKEAEMLDPLVRWVGQVGDALELAGEFNAQSNEDGRQRELASIVRRRGQPEFRAKLLDAYQGRCAMTGCATKEVLEAAHIVPYRGAHTNVVVNGILLRADIHTLFDLGLIAVAPDSMSVAIAPTLFESHYAVLKGRVIATPLVQADRPDGAALKIRHDEFVQRHRVPQASAK